MRLHPATRGTATNIVPNVVTIKGEVRSHDEKKMGTVTDKIVSSFKGIVENYNGKTSDGARPRFEAEIQKDFPRTYVPDDHPVVTLARRAAENLGRKMKTKTSGGGADANIFFEKGIMTGVFGTGMRDMHTARESVRLDDMVRTTELLLEIIRVHAESGKDEKVRRLEGETVG